MRSSVLAIVMAATLAGCGQSEAATASVLVAPPAAAAEKGQQVAVFAGGCFWGMEAVFEHTRGVTGVVSGYAGGTKESANYSAVSSERTAHAEAVRVTYDPSRISYGQLLQIYFYAAHDPTQVNRQGPDLGPSYRSAIFPQNGAQRATATAYIAALGKARVFGKPLATRIEGGQFFAAEAYHQDFMRRNPNHGYIQRWDVPKLAKFKSKFPGFYKG